MRCSEPVFKLRQEGRKNHFYLKSNALFILGFVSHIPPQLGYQSASVDLGLLSLRSVVTALADPRRKARSLFYHAICKNFIQFGRDL